MPNKHKNSKLRTKLLLSGKLNKKKEVQSTLKYLAEKDALDKEDINFDFENDTNDFGKLEDGDDDTRKLRNPKKRKNTNNSTNEIKKPRFDEQPENKSQKKTNKKSEEIVPKKSKKNKYFFMAHPEALDKKEEILSKEKSNFVIDEQKIKANQQKKQKNSNQKKIEVEKKIEKKDKQKSKDKLWAIEECNSEGEEDEKVKKETNKTVKKKNKKSEELILDFTDIDKNFKIKKTIKKLEDGTSIEVFGPQFLQDDSKDDDEEEDENEEQYLNEIDEDDEDEQNEEVEKENSEQNEGSDKNLEEKSSFTNNAMEKLKSSRFRYLNELLYTQNSSKSFEFFKNDEDSFTAYHEGFKSQISKWPINPLDKIIKYIKSRPANLVVADLGCGEARLAQSVKNKVHSFDLVAVNDLVVRCDMKKLPLESNTCDIVVFCLSLMGTNVVDFLCEAHRILKLKGVLKIAEVVSRIKDKSEFIKNVEFLGFKLVSKKDEISEPNSKDYFYFFDFVKMSPTIKKKPVIKLNPCFYKKR